MRTGFRHILALRLLAGQLAPPSPHAQDKIHKPDVGFPSAVAQASPPSDRRWPGQNAHCPARLPAAGPNMLLNPHSLSQAAFGALCLWRGFANGN